MKIKMVTLTGADDSIVPAALQDITKTFPYVEWGILLSGKQMGRKRFPSKEWMDKLNKLGCQNLSGHLCGRWVSDLVINGDVSFTHEIPLWDSFKRIQLNFHAEKFELTKDGLGALRNLCWKEHKEFIIQMDGVNNDIYKQLNFAGVNSSGLFDASHGAGVLPTEWPKEIPSMNPRAWRGYAGGLGPDNIEEQLKIMSSSVGDDVVWIDMETKIRSDNDLLFDLDKCVKCLERSGEYT